MPVYTILLDLVPKENLQRWLKYLRREFPTIAFKASVLEASETFVRKRKNPELASEGLRQSSVCLGADSLMQLLGNYTRNKGLKTSIVVGVVGQFVLCFCFSMVRCTKKHYNLPSAYIAGFCQSLHLHALVGIHVQNFDL